ncbi:MAG TPA: hypothetical protein VMH83_12325 [Candidatus Acidoferrum sp.]|nr:hypothetical protein [Candidatus Acidoferrum sp.]
MNKFITAAALSLVAGATLAATSNPAVDCDRACLNEFADVYLDAMLKHDVSRLPLAKDVKFTENGVQMKVGDGLWNTINGKRNYNLRLADPSQAQVALVEVVTEHDTPAILATRMKIADGKIAEIETVLSRKIDTSPFPATDGLEHSSPLWAQTVPEAKRVRRERMISIADGYFNTIQQNDGHLFTDFTDDCDRVENGLQTTHNGKIADYDIAKMGCADQFKLGQYIYDDRLRDRRFPLVDEEKGIVLAAGFMDHSGKIVDVTWTDGKTKAKSVFFYPHSFILIELFKIDGNAIKRVEAVFASMPYNMPTVW